MQIVEYSPGMKITPPMLVLNMPNDVYHAWPDSVSKSGLELIERSPAHYKYRSQRKPTRAMEIGTAIHTALLEPERFDSEYVKLEGVTARTDSAYKQAAKVHGGEYVLTATEAGNVVGMMESVYSNPIASKWLNQEGYREASLFVIDPETGILVRCRYDLLTLGLDIVDVKKAEDARPDAFSRSVFNYGYDMQAALYSDALTWATDIDHQPAFRFLAVEIDAPNASMVYKADETMLSEGRKRYRDALNTYAECVNADNWPAYECSEDEIISLPDWRLRQIENDSEVFFED